MESRCCSWFQWRWKICQAGRGNFHATRHSAGTECFISGGSCKYHSNHRIQIRRTRWRTSQMMKTIFASYRQDRFHYQGGPYRYVLVSTDPRNMHIIFWKRFSRETRWEESYHLMNYSNIPHFSVIKISNFMSHSWIKKKQIHWKIQTFVTSQI